MNKDQDDLIRRAYAAYFRSGANQQPSSVDSGFEFHKRKGYVVLRSGGEILAVYRVRNNGALKGLRRYPKAFNSTS